MDAGVMRELSGRIYDAAGSARQIGRVEMNGETRELWATVYPKLSDGKPGLFGAVTGRAEAQTVRLALLYALLDGVNVIAPPHLKAALAIWEYCEQSVAHIFGDAAGDPVADNILVALRAAVGGLTRSQLSAVLNRNVPAARMGAALDALENSGRVLRTTLTSAGRPAELWRAT